MLFSEWSLITETANLIAEEYFVILENEEVQPLPWKAAVNVLTHIISKESKPLNRRSKQPDFAERPDEKYSQYKDAALKTMMLAARRMGMLKAGEAVSDDDGNQIEPSEELLQAIEAGSKNLPPVVTDVIRKGNEASFYIGEMIKNNISPRLTGYKKFSPQHDELAQHVADFVIRRLTQKTKPVGKDRKDKEPYWKELPNNPLAYAGANAPGLINKNRSSGKAKSVADVEAVPKLAGGTDAVKDIEHAKSYATDFPDVYRQGIQHLVQYGRGEPTAQGLPLNIIAALIAKTRFKHGAVSGLSVDPKNQNKRSEDLLKDAEIREEVQNYLRDYFGNSKLKMTDSTWDKASSYSHNYLRKWVMDPSRRHSQIVLPGGKTEKPLLNRYDLDQMRVVNKKVGDFKLGRKDRAVPLEEV